MIVEECIVCGVIIDTDYDDRGKDLAHGYICYDCWERERSEALAEEHGEAKQEMFREGY